MMPSHTPTEENSPPTYPVVPPLPPFRSPPSSWPAGLAEHHPPLRCRQPPQSDPPAALSLSPASVIARPEADLSSETTPSDADGSHSVGGLSTVGVIPASASRTVALNPPPPPRASTIRPPPPPAALPTVRAGSDDLTPPATTVREVAAEEEEDDDGEAARRGTERS